MPHMSNADRDFLQTMGLHNKALVFISTDHTDPNVMSREQIRQMLGKIGSEIIIDKSNVLKYDEKWDSEIYIIS